jgi:hypothetical protein
VARLVELLDMVLEAARCHGNIAAVPVSPGWRMKTAFLIESGAVDGAWRTTPPTQLPQLDRQTSRVLAMYARVKRGIVSAFATRNAPAS